MIVIRKKFSDQSGDEKNATAKAVGAAIGGAGVGALGGWGAAKTLEKYPPGVEFTFINGSKKKVITGKDISKWAKNNKKYLVIPGALIGSGVALNNIRKERKRQ